MATQTITLCDGGAPNCEEEVKARIVLQAMRDHTIISIAQLDSCTSHIGNLVDSMYDDKESLVNSFNKNKEEEFEKMTDSEKRRYGGLTPWVLTEIEVRFL
jgi:hypothetical protein